MKQVIDQSPGRTPDCRYKRFYNNPIGEISTPTLLDTAGYSDWWLRDSSGTGTIENNKEYTCSESPKNIYISGGTVSGVYVNGEQVFSETNVMVHLEPADSIEIEWDIEPTITVMGE